MHTSTVPFLASYIRTWSLHHVHIGLASTEAMTRSGLTHAMMVQLFGAACLDGTAPGLQRAVAQFGSEPVDVLVSDDALAYRFPHAHRERLLRGMANPDFLEPHHFVDRLLPVLDRLGTRARVVVLRMVPISPAEQMPFLPFLSKLDRFLAILPRPYRFALEPPNALVLRPEYFFCLRNRGVAHVFSDGDGVIRSMPSISEQLAISGAMTKPYCVVRSEAWFRVPGIAWPRANAGVRRRGWSEALRKCLSENVPLYLLADDESDPLGSLNVLMTMVNDDLARRSVLRRRAA